MEYGRVSFDVLRLKTVHDLRLRDDWQGGKGLWRLVLILLIILFFSRRPRKPLGSRCWTQAYWHQAFTFVKISLIFMFCSMVVMTLHMNVFECVLFSIAHMVGISSQELSSWGSLWMNLYIPSTHCFLLLTVLSFSLPSFLLSSFGTLNSIWFLWLCCCLWLGTTSSSHRGRIPGKMWWVTW